MSARSLAALARIVSESTTIWGGNSCRAVAMPPSLNSTSKARRAIHAGSSWKANRDSLKRILPTSSKCAPRKRRFANHVERPVSESSPPKMVVFASCRKDRQSVHGPPFSRAENELRVVAVGPGWR